MGTPFQLSFFYVCVSVCNFTFIITVPFSPKYVSSILCIYGLFAGKSEQQGSDTLEAVNCWSPLRWCCLYLQIKDVFFFFHFGVASLFRTAVSLQYLQTATRWQKHRRDRVKKIWTKYNLYSLYTLHTMQYYKAFYTFTFHQSSAHWSESTSTIPSPTQGSRGDGKK